VAAAIVEWRKAFEDAFPGHEPEPEPEPALAKPCATT
jgi:hypothetical protein